MHENISSDVLSSASLLLAALTTLYSLFYAEINSILDIEPKTGSTKSENLPDYNKAKKVRNSKVIPLLAGSIMLSLVFIPQFCGQLANCYAVYKAGDVDMSQYNTTNASYVAVTVFVLALTMGIILLAIRFFIQLKNLRP